MGGWAAIQPCYALCLEDHEWCGNGQNISAFYCYRQHSYYGYD